MLRTISLTLAGLVAVVLVFFTIPVLFHIEGADNPRHTCASNLRQLGLALLQYEQDNDNILPPRQNTSGPNGVLVSWRYLIFPYDKSTALYQCPLNPAGRPSRSAPQSPPPPGIAADDLGPSYAVNSTSDGAQSFGPFADQFHDGVPMSGVGAPAQTIGIVESTAAANDFNPLVPGQFAKETNVLYSAGHLFSGHNHASNTLFLDGHIRWMTPMQTLPQSGPNPWTVDGAPFPPADQSKANSTIRYSEQTYQNAPDETPRKHLVIRWGFQR